MEKACEIYTSHILMPSPSMYYARISSPRLEILPKGLEIICSKKWRTVTAKMFYLL